LRRKHPTDFDFRFCKVLLRTGIHYTLNSTAEFESALERDRYGVEFLSVWVTCHTLREFTMRRVDVQNIAS